MVTPRVDRDFTSKLVGIDGLGRCCGENSPADASDASDASGDLGFHLTFICLLESGRIRFYMVLHGFLRCYQSQLSQSSPSPITDY